MRSRDSRRIVDSSGNVFRDLGLDSDQKDMVKVHLALAISALLHERSLTQIQAAEILGIDQSFLTRLDRDIDIRVTAKRKNRPARIRVEAA
jgi:predicted XRE-type DNA-binding protein